jgi:hypothetical protein
MIKQFDNKILRISATTAGEDARMERATNAQVDSQATELIALTLMNVNKEGSNLKKC